MPSLPSRKLTSESFWITLLSKAGQKINQPQVRKKGAFLENSLSPLYMHKAPNTENSFLWVSRGIK